jgi:hypothetical protein
MVISHQITQLYVAVAGLRTRGANAQCDQNLRIPCRLTGAADCGGKSVGIRHVVVRYNSAYNFNFEIDLEHASLRDKDGLEISKQRIESSDKHYSGHFGNSSSGNLIKINSDYGSVSLKKIN